MVTRHIETPKEKRLRIELQRASRIENTEYLRAGQLAIYLGVSINLLNSNFRKRTDFPKPVQLSENVRVWSKSEINEWMLNKERSTNELKPIRKKGSKDAAGGR